MRLFGSGNQVDELTPERVFEMTGVRMEEDPPDILLTYSGIGDMADDRGYWFVLSNSSSTGNKLRIEISNRRITNATIDAATGVRTVVDVPRPSICGFDLGQYKMHLEQMGFKGSLYRGGMSNAYWHFFRGQLSIRLYAVAES